MLTDRAFAELFSDLDAEPLERRTNPRATVVVAVVVSCDEGLFPATSRDLSEGGVFLVTPRQLPVGTIVALGIALPNGPICVRGTVRWTGAGGEHAEGFGVELSEVSEEAHRIIAAYRAGLVAPAHARSNARERSSA